MRLIFILFVLLVVGYFGYQKFVATQDNSAIDKPTQYIEMGDKPISRESMSAPATRVASIFSEPLTGEQYQKYNNYFDVLLQKNTLYRWNKRHLTYYIESKARRRMNISLLRKGFAHWEKKSKFFTFAETTSPDSADIYVQLASTATKERLGEAGPDKLIMGNSYAIDGTRYTENIIQHASITLSEDNFSFDKIQKYQELGKGIAFTTFVHEMGHVLGIMGHSPRQGDCMYFQMDRDGKACDVMTSDVNTLAMLYGVPRPLNRGFQDAQVITRY